MPGIFISYRRQDSQSAAGRLADSLKEQLPEAALFRDVETIEAGDNFVRAIDGALESCGVLLAVIGPRWVSIQDAAGRRRLDDPGDYTRLELATALARPDVRVIPVLVDGAVMPAPQDLPDDLKALSLRNAVELTDKRWDYDVAQLARTLRRCLGLKLPISRNTWRWVGAAAAVLVAASAGFFLNGGDGKPPPGETVQVPDMVRMEGTAATQLLTNLRLAALEESVETEALPPGRVARQSPEPNQSLPLGGQVTLYIAVPLQVAVPPLIGQPLDAARQALESIGLTAGVTEQVATDAAPPDTVMGQIPSAGARIAKGQAVNLKLAVAYPPVPVPNVIGIPVQQAEQTLSEAGLKPERARLLPRTSAQARADHVQDQSPDPGQQVKRGGLVRLTVWSSAVRLPNVIGYEARRAIDELAGYGLRSRADYREIGTVKPGVIIGQQPAAGADQAGDGQVVLTVAKAPVSAASAPRVSLSPQVLAVLRSKNLLIQTATEIATTRATPEIRPATPSRLIVRPAR